MRVLLDTHALIWALEDSEKLPAAARAVLEDGNNDVLVSAACAWEIAIKKSLGKLQAPSNLLDAVNDAGFIHRPINLADAQTAESLPPLHTDAFDRMLIAQALNDGIPLVTRDPLIGQYAVQILW